MKFFELISLLIQQHKRSATIFLSVGALAAIIYFGTFAILYNLLHINYKIAVSIGYVLSVIFHFTANRRFTFQSHQHNIFQQLPRYIIMIMINYFITLIVVHFVVTVAQLSPYLGIAFSIITTTGISYILAKTWVFNSGLKQN